MAQPTWAKIYGGSADDQAVSIVSTADGNFIVGGWTESAGAGNADLWVFSVNAEGDLLWSKTLGFSGEETMTRMRAVDGGGVIVVATTTSFGSGDEDAWVLRLDSGGDPVWQRRIGGGEDDALVDVKQTVDGGFVAVGRTGSLGSAPLDEAWVVKLAADGAVEWERSIGVDGIYDVATAVIAGSDGSIALATIEHTTGDGEVHVVKLDAAGSLLWQKRYATRSEARSGLETSNGDLLFAGLHWPVDDTVAWVMRVSAAGTAVWQRGRFSGEDPIFREIVEDGTLGFAGAGRMVSDSPWEFALVIALDTDGFLRWEERFTEGSSSRATASSIARTTNAGFVVAGSRNEAATDAWLTRLDSTGARPESCPQTPDPDLRAWERSLSQTDASMNVAPVGIPAEVTIATAQDFAATETLICSLFDFDADGVLDSEDNCIEVPNPEQVDDDLDSFGAACDCDDTDETVYPGATQNCDGINNDCDHPNWPALSGSNEFDDDGDGMSECGGDCDDSLASVYPGAPELCDGLNNDCDSPTYPTPGDEEVDSDGDHFSECDGDCDDADSTVYPGAPNLCDGLNNDCDDPAWPSLVGTNEADDDEDGFSECAGDCDDASPGIAPDAMDTCDHVDNNCDGVADENATTARSRVFVPDPRPQLGAQMGRAVAGLGDIDGDSADDFAIGVPHEDTDRGIRAGKVLVFSGMDATLHCVIEDTQGNPTARLGFSLLSIDDVNGDGVRELAIGSFKRSTETAVDAGAVLIYSPVDCRLVRILFDPEGFPNSTFGFSIARAGDLTGDGVEELIVGAPGFDYPEAEGGSALVLSPSDGSVVLRLGDPSDSVGDRLGFSVGAVGDVDGDGIPDLAVGSPNREAAGLVGTLLLFSGADGTLIRQIWDGSSNLGHTIVGGVDLSGDGLPDLVATSGEGGRGSVFSATTGARLWQLDEPDPFSAGADRMTFVPDRDEDGVTDILLGRPRYTGLGPLETGHALVFSGADGSLLETIADPDGVAGDNLGSAVGHADVNADGRADLILGAVGDSEDRGGVWLIVDESDCDGDGAPPYGGADCDDSDASVYRGAEEVLDGKDNECPTDPGFGAVDDLSGTIGFFDPDDSTTLSWPTQGGATLYEIVRSPSALFAPSCSGDTTPATSWTDLESPEPASAFHYLVRALAPLEGSWGVSSGGAERSTACP